MTAYPNYNSNERGLVIIGNGITGITAARTVRKLHPKIRIRILSRESDYFFSRTALMYIYMGHMRLEDTYPYERQFYKKNKLELIRDQVLGIDTNQNKLKLQEGKDIYYDMLLLATGSTYNKFNWPGQDLLGVQGLYSLQDLELLEENTKGNIEKAVIVGGGLIGIELGEMLHTRNIDVTFLVREKNYWGNILPVEEATMIAKEIRRHNIKLELSTQLKEILAEDNQGHGQGDRQVCAVLTDQGEKIPCQLVGLTVGVSPNLNVLTSTDYPSNIETERGILVERDMRTNISSVFAAGDCAQLRQASEYVSSPIEQLWYTGRMQGSVAGRFIAREAYKQEGNTKKLTEISHEPYTRGVLFNSAKFFTIEYQTYGHVPCQLSPESTFIWRHPHKNCLIRLVWDGGDPYQSPIKGMNFMGTRYRQEVCIGWIEQKKKAADVAASLYQANFDPEFYQSTHRLFQQSFVQKYKNY